MTHISLIISVQEARELLGNEADGMTDEQIERLIEELDAIAKYSLKQAVSELIDSSHRGNSRN